MVDSSFEFSSLTCHDTFLDYLDYLKYLKYLNAQDSSSQKESLERRGEHSQVTVEYDVKASFEIPGKNRPKRVTKKFSDIVAFNNYLKSLDENPLCFAYNERMELLAEPGYLYEEVA